MGGCAVSRAFYVIDSDDFAALSAMRERLHNKQDRMTFDEQRDFAERMRLLLERAVRTEESQP